MRVLVLAVCCNCTLVVGTETKTFNGDASAESASAEDASAERASADVNVLEAGDTSTCDVPSCNAVQSTCLLTCDQAASACDQQCPGGKGGNNCRDQCLQQQQQCRADCVSACTTCVGNCGAPCAP